ncbi:sialate O-acetylesterase [Chitinophaga sp. Cy-1792]|uniref:sialate O-acetylesterase n=1 Tax=Chitinophaga sp. Cy-1792 TaxID=2608339 RepID=UPI0014218D25|nr:sialate O-acetylesterase [Chitinophaga sp. Cy-1792]NIG55210.1 sialate O-acetylesterase [Chitinophaga sp. Cy-1792]
MIRYILLIAGIVSTMAVAAQLKVAPVFGDHMVLQRNKPLHVYGKGLPGTQISGLFKHQHATTVVQQDSSWLLIFPAFAAAAKPDVLTVTDKRDTITLTDLLVGDVWLCAGQSNMEFPLADDLHAKETLAAAAIPHLRLLQENKATSTYAVPYTIRDTVQLHPEKYFSGSWKRADAAAARPFSAVGYYFGRKIAATTGVPIGLINVAVGGSPCEAWIRPAAGRAVEQVQSVFEGNWWQNAALEPWCIQRGHENLDSLLAKGVQPPANELGYRHPFQPGFLYEAGVMPFLQLQIKGVIWYQGESNALSAERVEQHSVLFPLMVADWRKQWQDTTLPFYFCQISSISTEKGYKSENWPGFRDAQRRMAGSIPYSGMAVTSDVGHRTNIHPKEKRTVGERLALVALHNSYADKHVATGPLPLKVSYRDDEVVIEFDGRLYTADKQALRGFSLEAGVEVPAVINGNTVHIKALRKPETVYYGWQPYTDANLVNAAGLPASTMKLTIP